MNRIYPLLILIAVHFTTPAAMAQTGISGYVRDSSTGEPLEAVNVFLNRTSLGAASGSDGFYVFNNVPEGQYELVVSRIGYELQTVPVTVTEAPFLEFNFELKQTPIEMDRVEIIADFPEDWQKNFDKFKTYFLGSSENSEECEIINPYVLDFSKQGVLGAFSAAASDWLEIENRALGFRVFFNLKDFIYYRSGEITYAGQIRFEEMQPDNPEALKKWRANRARTYSGSLRHFLWALASGKLAEEGFVLHHTNEVKWDEMMQVNFKAVDPEQILATKSPSGKILRFENYLKVIYLGEEEEKNYFAVRTSLGSGLKQRQPAQVSWFTLPSDSTEIMPDGTLEDVYGIKVYGHWAWERIADLLPLNYDPKAPDGS